MRCVPGHVRVRFAIVGVLALAMACIGFAHRPGLAADEARLAAYIAVGGAISDLCASQGGAARHDASKICDACRLVGAAMLRETQGMAVWQRGYVLARGAIPRADVAAMHTRDPSRAVRAPPVLRS